MNWEVGNAGRRQGRHWRRQLCSGRGIRE